MIKNNVEDFDKHKMQRLLRDFGVHNENELQKKLDRESKTIPCSICGKEISSGDFIDGDPICWDCANGDTEDD
jgi:hypothetical protein